MEGHDKSIVTILKLVPSLAESFGREAAAVVARRTVLGSSTEDAAIIASFLRQMAERTPDAANQNEPDATSPEDAGDEPMMQDHERLAAALLRSHLHLFVQKAFYSLHPGKDYSENWHVEAMCHALDQVASGECRRLLITVPPRHLKSICTAVALPAWLLGRDPACKIMVASYGADLASKHAGDCRAIMETDWYRLLYPELRIERNTAQQLTTTGTRRNRGGSASEFQ